jgi:hypothetical protein
MHKPSLNRLFRSIASFSLLISFLLQSCNFITKNLPVIIRDLKKDHASPFSKTSLNSHPEQDEIVNVSSLGLGSHVFTASSGEKIIFLKEAGTWKAKIVASYLDLGLDTTLPVICEHQGDILTMVYHLSKQEPSIHKHSIHLLPSPCLSS